MLEYVDIKNGVDIYNDDGFILFVAYGASYKSGSDYQIVKHTVLILPYDDNRHFLKVLSK